MATAKGGSAMITLQCPDCKERNYTTVKNRRNDPDRLELKKFCSRCRSHTRHRETKSRIQGPAASGELTGA